MSALKTMGVAFTMALSSMFMGDTVEAQSTPPITTEKRNIPFVQNDVFDFNSASIYFNRVNGTVDMNLNASRPDMEDDTGKEQLSLHIKASQTAAPDFYNGATSIIFKKIKYLYPQANGNPVIIPGAQANSGNFPGNFPGNNQRNPRQGRNNGYDRGQNPAQAVDPRNLAEVEIQIIKHHRAKNQAAVLVYKQGSGTATAQNISYEADTVTFRGIGAVDLGSTVAAADRQRAADELLYNTNAILSRPTITQFRANYSTNYENDRSKRLNNTMVLPVPRTN